MLTVSAIITSKVSLLIQTNDTVRTGQVSTAGVAHVILLAVAESAYLAVESYATK